MNCDNQCCENKHDHYINDRYGINVTAMAHTQEPLVVEHAAELVPDEMRKPGTKITFWTFDGWQTWQFQPMDVREWVLPESWVQDTEELKDIQNQIDSIQIGGWAISNEFGNNPHIGISQKTLTERFNDIAVPDEEDLTDANGSIKIKDNVYNEAIFSGLGKKIIRKNLVGNINLLTQGEIIGVNTVYVVKYDFDLNGETITIPVNSVLMFDGGSFHNGKLVGNDTKIVTSQEYYDTFINIDFEGNWDYEGFFVAEDFVLAEGLKTRSNEVSNVYSNYLLSARYYFPLSGLDVIRTESRGLNVTYVFYDNGFNNINDGVSTSDSIIQIPNEAKNGYCSFYIYSNDIRKQEEQEAYDFIVGLHIYCNLLKYRSVGVLRDFVINTRTTANVYSPNVKVNTQSFIAVNETTNKYNGGNGAYTAYIAAVNVYNHRYSSLQITANSTTAAIVYFVKNKPIVNADIIYSDYVSKCTILTGQTDLLPIPSDADYIIINGRYPTGDRTPTSSKLLANSSKLVQLEEKENITDEARRSDRESLLSSINIFSWNVGHFSVGQHVYTSVDDNNYDDIRNSLVELTGRYYNYWFLLEEYSDIFAELSTGNVRADTMFNNYSFGKHNGESIYFHKNVGFYKKNLINVEQFRLSSMEGVVSTHPSPIPAWPVYITHYTVTINGLYCHIFHVHATAKLSSEDASSYWTELAEIAGSYSRSVIVGDCNTTRGGLAPLTNAGFTLANPQVEGQDVPTFFRGTTLDWCAYKGVTISNFEVVDTELTRTVDEQETWDTSIRMTDHYPIAFTISCLKSRKFMDSGAGSSYFDEILNKPLWKAKENCWVDAAGNAVVTDELFKPTSGVIAASGVASGKWLAEPEDRKYAPIDVSSYRGENIVIYANSVNRGTYAFLKSLDVLENNAVDYATGWEIPLFLELGSVVTVTVPSDASYLYLYGYRTDTSFNSMPQYVVLEHEH